MEIDVLYRVAKDLAWQYINRFVKESSVSLAIYRSCPDQFITKKTIRNAAGRLTPGGIFCIQVLPENMSDIIRLMRELGYKYKVVHFDFTWATDESLVSYVLAYKSEVNNPKIGTLVRLESMEDMACELVNLCDFGDLILCVGDAALAFVDKAKMLGRSVIAFGDDQTFAAAASCQGVREIVL